MRRWTWLLGLIGALVACGTGQSNAPTTNEITAEPSRFQLLIPATDFVVGEPRVPLVVFDGPDPAQGVTGLQVTLFEIQGQTATPVWQGEATAYDDFETPYWVFYPSVPTPGVWGLQTTIQLADGSQTIQQRSLEVKETGSAPMLGAIPPAVTQPTLATQPDITRLSSAENPDPALYQMTIADALRSGRPSVITFATPAFCQTRICAPVVDSVAAVMHAHAGSINFLHVEIYADFQTLAVADAVRAWGLDSEPWTFVLDAQGIVRARLAGPLAPSELEEALQGVIN